MSENIILKKEDYPGKCSCGREHTMSTEKMVIGKDAMYGFADILAEQGYTGKFCAVYDKNTYEAMAGKRPQCAKELILDPENLHANEIGLQRLADQFEACDFLVAIGGGTIHDLTRYTATEKNIPFISVPTAASVDGFTASVAAMTLEGFKKTVSAQAPRIVVGDTEVISKAPMYLTASGFGDVLGKYVSLTDWRISRELTGEYFCDYTADLTMQAVVDTCKAGDGIAAGDPDAYGLLAKALLLSGIAMQMVGNSRPASGAEHHCSHLIEMGVPWLPATEALHGEKVGVGTLMVIPVYRSWIGKGPEKLIDSIAAFKGHDAKEMEAVYGPRLAGQIIEENANNCLNKVTPQALEEKWGAVQDLLKALPSEDQVRKSLLQVGGLTTLDEIAEPQDKAAEILRWSPYVRNRLTFNRMLHTLG